MISEIVLEEKLNNKDGSEGFLHDRSHEEEQLQMGKCAMYSKREKNTVIWMEDKKQYRDR